MADQTLTQSSERLPQGKAPATTEQDNMSEEGAMNEQQSTVGRPPRTTIMDRDGRVYTTQATGALNRRRLAAWWRRAIRQLRSWWPGE